MQPRRFLRYAVLSMLVGCSALMFSQDEKQQEDKPARQEEPKPQPKQDEAKPAHPENNPRGEARPENQDNRPANRPETRDESKPQQMHQENDARDHARPEQQEHPEQRDAHAQPAGRGGHIPDDKFRAHFGHGHNFHARGVIVSGQQNFVYEGYTFQFVDAWPADWAYTDDCYIDYVDGEYFLFDVLHPGTRIALIVVM